LAGIEPIMKPCDFNQLDTLETVASVGANRARQVEAETYFPYWALAGSETARASASAPAESRIPSTAVICCACAAGVWPTRAACAVHAGAASSAVRGDVVAAKAVVGTANASATAVQVPMMAPVRTVDFIYRSFRCHNGAHVIERPFGSLCVGYEVRKGFAPICFVKFWSRHGAICNDYAA
jgi:hypothetical protein